MKKLVIVAIVLALLVGCSQTGAKPTATPGAAKKVKTSGVSAQGYVTPVKWADLSFRTGGRVAEVLVKEGDAVKAGQPLIRLQDAELVAAVAQAQAELDRLQAGARAEEIASTQAGVQVAEAQVKSAQLELDKVKSGAQQSADIASAKAQLQQTEIQLKSAQDTLDGITSARSMCHQYGAKCGGLGLREEQVRVQLTSVQATYDAARTRLSQAYSSGAADAQSAQAKLNIALAQRDVAQAQLYLTKAGATPEQIEAAKARVAQAQAALDETVLLAPFDGVLAELPIQKGEMVAPGPRVASLADLTRWQVETDDLSEVDVVNVQVGAEVNVTVDALPGVTLKGKVAAVMPRSVVKRGDVTYTVKVALTEPDAQLRWGMTAFVDIK